jgi:hypothetical protein
MMLSRFRQIIAEVLEAEEEVVREEAIAIQAHFATAAERVARIGHGLQSLDRGSRRAAAGVVWGLALMFVSEVLSSTDGVGAYLLRAGILLAGLGLARLLRP